MSTKAGYGLDKVWKTASDWCHHITHIEEVVLLGAPLIEKHLNIGIQRKAVVKVAKHIQATSLEEGVHRDIPDAVVLAPVRGEAGVDSARRHRPQGLYQTVIVRLLGGVRVTGLQHPAGVVI